MVNQESLPDEKVHFIVVYKYMQVTLEQSNVQELMHDTTLTTVSEVYVILKGD